VFLKQIFENKCKKLKNNYRSVKLNEGKIKSENSNKWLNQQIKRDPFSKMIGACI
jgi:hypothetical protein